MNRIEKLEREVQQIKLRNRKVEADKAWELSWTRKFLIAILTYIAIVAYFYFAGLPEPFLNSIVPTTAFLISTLSISYFNKIWIKYIYKPRHPLESEEVKLLKSKLKNRV